MNKILSESRSAQIFNKTCAKTNTSILVGCYSILTENETPSWTTVNPSTFMTNINTEYMDG